MFKVLIFGIFIVVSVTACKTRTVVYTSPTSRPSVAYVRTPGRVVTNTVYVDREESHPTALPGQSRRLPEPGDPSNFPAAANQ